MTSAKGQRRGGWRWVAERRYMRIRVGAGKRETIPLPACRSDVDADERAALIADVAARLIAAGRLDKVRDFAVQLGAATSEKLVARALAAVDLVVGSQSAPREAVTFRTFAERWTSGELHRLYPDRVPAIDHAKSIGRLQKYVYPVVGDIPLVRFTLEDAERVMFELPPELSSASRRHVAQLLIRISRLATYPGKIIPVCPIPRGFLPKKPPEKAKPYLYPAEDAQLLACKQIPLVRRLVWGVLAREGMRASELFGLQWVDVDLAAGLVHLDENKSKRPRSWALDPHVLAVLKIWKTTMNEDAKPTDLVFDLDKFPGAKPQWTWKGEHLAEQLRRDLVTAKVTRAKLFERSDARARIVAHHLRATFVTLALANGKTETWVQDRTGHTTSMMINRYRRVARAAAEIGLGPLLPLNQAIPEFATKKGRSKR